MAEEKVLLSRRESIARDIWKRPEHREKVVHCVSRGGTGPREKGPRGRGKEREGTKREGEKVGEGSLELEHMVKMTGLYGKKAGGREDHELKECKVAGGVRSVEKRSHRWNEPRDHHRLVFAHRYHS